MYIGSSDQRLYALVGDTGTKKWEYGTGGALTSPAIGADGTVYAASSDNRIHALDGITGSNRWTYVIEVPEGSTYYAPAALAVGVDGIVYFRQYQTRGFTPSSTLMALSGASGAIQWQLSLGSYSTESPTLDPSGNVYMVSSFPYAVAWLDGRTGQTVGSTGLRYDAAFGSPIIGGDGTIYFSTRTGRPGYMTEGLTAWNSRTSSQAWLLNGLVSTEFALGADGTLHGGLGSVLFALDSATGKTNWQFQAEGPIRNCPAIGLDGTVFFGSGNGVCAVEGTSVGGLAKTGWPKFNHDARNTGCVEFPTNRPPVLTVAGDQVIDELATLTVTNTATDPDLPATPLAFELLSPPPGAAIDPLTGVVTWTPTEAQGASTNTIVVRVTDSGVPRLSATNSFRVIVKDGSQIPVHQRWVFPTGGAISECLAIGPDGTVYFGSADTKVYALNGASGDKLWEFPTGGPVRSSPAFGPGATLYFGSEDGNVYAVDSATSQPKWTFPTGGFVNTSPALGVDGTVYIAAGDEVHPGGNRVFALDGATGAKIWDYQIAPESTLRTWSSPAVGANGTVYVGSMDTKIYALNGAAGTKIWDFPTGAGVHASPAVGADGTVFCGSADSKLYALIGATGEKKWEFAAGFWIYGSAAIGNQGRLYVGSLDTNVYALDIQTGARQWAVKTGHWVFGSPAIAADGTVYAAAFDGVVYALDGVTGGKKWLFRTGSTLQSSPAVGPDGTVYVGTQEGKVYALNGGDTGGLAQSPWPKFHRNARNTGNALASEVNTAPVLSVPANLSVDELTTLRVTNTATDQDLPANTLTFGLVAPPDGVALDAATGVLTWTPTEAQGPSTNRITVWVADNGVPPLSATNSFTVVVNEVNAAPVLGVPANLSVDELTTLRVTHTATDPDLPANALTFGLVTAPDGVRLDAATGVLTWTPTEAQGPSTNRITVWVTDNGVPPLSATNSFTVVVNEVNTAPVLTTAVRDYTVTAGATLVFASTAADSDIPPNGLTFMLDLDAPPGAAIDRNTGVFTWTATGSPATNQFTIWITDDGVPYRSGSQAFTVVTLPKPRDLEFGGIQRNADGRIALTWAAKPGARYQLQYKHRLDETTWTGIGDPLTATSETLSLTETIGTEDQRFYRVMMLAD